MDDRFIPPHDALPQPPRWLVNANDEVAELIRISNRLRHRSIAVQRAATRAGVNFRDVVQRCMRVCQK